MAAETRIGIVAGLLIVIIASVYFFRNSGSRDDELLVSGGSRITVAPTATVPADAGESTVANEAPQIEAEADRRVRRADRPANKLENRLAMNRPAPPPREPRPELRGSARPASSGAGAADSAVASSEGEATVATREPTSPVKLRTEPSTDLVKATWENLMGSHEGDPDASAAGADLATVSERIRRSAQAPLGQPSTGGLETPAVNDRGRPAALPADHSERPVWRRLTDVVTPQTASSPGAAGTEPWPRRHVIDPGDTLEEIALDHYGDRTMVAAILAANPAVKGPKQLRIGQALTLPAPQRSAAASSSTRKELSRRQSTLKSRTYVVQAGDTLYTIASRTLGNGPRWREILRLNAQQLDNNPKRLSPGMILTLPPTGPSR